MKELIKKLQKISLEDIVKMEYNDRQFLAINNINICDNKHRLIMILANSLVCYQLSWKWEEYWEEFSSALISVSSKQEIYDFFDWFLINSKNNKRFVNIKLKRITKFLNIYTNLIDNDHSLVELAWLLARTMKQKKDDKTIVFAIKMYVYWLRSINNEIIYYPQELNIPIDSRLIKIYEKYRLENQSAKEFYFKLSAELGLAPLHLDSLLWLSGDNNIDL